MYIVKYIGDMLEYMRLIPKNFLIHATQKETLKIFYTLASTHACTGGRLPCTFLKIETILKTMP